MVLEDIEVMPLLYITMINSFSLDSFSDTLSLPYDLFVWTLLKNEYSIVSISTIKMPTAHCSCVPVRRFTIAFITSLMSMSYDTF